MNDTLIVALMSLAGTLIGSVTGIMTANKLTNFRISALESKVDKHNNLIERMAIVEQSTKSAHHRLDDFVDIYTNEKKKEEKKNAEAE